MQDRSPRNGVTGSSGTGVAGAARSNRIAILTFAAVEAIVIGAAVLTAILR